MRGSAAVCHSERPADRFEVHLADIGILPGLFGVTQCGIEDAPLAVHLAPGDGKVMICAMNTRVVVVAETAWIKAEQHVDLIAGPSFGLVNFVEFHELFREMA